jgi:PAS domain S-box-containing protein
MKYDHDMSSPAVFLEQINDAFFQLDKDWNFLFLNKAAEKLLNRGKHELLGTNIWDAFPEAIGSTFYKNYHDAVEQQKEIIFEEYYPPFKTWFYVKAYPTKSEGLWVFFSNINQLKETELKLRESEQNFESLFEKMTPGVVYQDAQRRIISANPAAERILGLTLDEMLGRVSADPRWKAMDGKGVELPGDKHPAVQALISRKPVIDFHMQLFNPKINQHRWLLVDSVPQFREGETEPFQVFSIFRDITDRQKALADREEMMRIITHDLRSPVRAAQALLSLVQDGIEHKMPEVKQEMKHLRKALQRAAELTDEFVGSVNLEQVSDTGPIPLSPVLEDIASTQQILVQDAGLEWQLETREPEKLVVSMDAPRLKKVLENLIGNAIKFTDAPGHIILRAYPDSAYVVLEVEDSGRGITETEREQIFKKFWQPDMKKKGAGLGLYIVKRIIDAHQGRIEIKSRVGKGTTFRVRLPGSPG